MNGWSRPWQGGPEEISRVGDSEADPTEAAAADTSVADDIRRSAERILLHPDPLGATRDEDLSARLHAAIAVVQRAPGLSVAERVAIARCLPWDVPCQKRWCL